MKRRRLLPRRTVLTPEWFAEDVDLDVGILLGELEPRLGNERMESIEQSTMTASIGQCRTDGNTTKRAMFRSTWLTVTPKRDCLR
jgi:hypothetical protein